MSKPRLTEEQIRLIRQSTMRNGPLALELGVSYVTVASVRQGKTYVNVATDVITCATRDPLPKRFNKQTPAGSRNGRSKLSEADIPEIRSSTDTIYVLAERYGVSAAAISHVRCGRSWKHV